MRKGRAAAGVFGLIGSLAVSSGAVRPQAALAQSPMPDRLADTTFWRLVTTFSEPSGFFASDNYVSNENEWQYVIPPALGRVKSGGAYIGVGPEQNFTYIAALQPRVAFICDIRRQNMLQHLLYKALIEASADRADLISMLFARPRPAGLDSTSTGAQLAAAFENIGPDSTLYARTVRTVFHRLRDVHGFTLQPGDSMSILGVYSVFTGAGLQVNYASGPGHIVWTVHNENEKSATQSEVRRPGYSTFASLMMEDDGAGLNRGWLGTEAAFRIVRDYETRNLMVPIVGDFAGAKALRSISGYLKEHDTKLSAFYVSNVEQYLFEDESTWTKFYRNVAVMPTDSSSIFIRSLSNRSQVQPRKPDSRLAQLTSSIDAVVLGALNGTMRSYFDLIELRDR